MNIFKRSIGKFNLSKENKAITPLQISEDDDMYKYYCEYRYQPTTVLYLEKIKLLSTLDTMNGAANMYLSGATVLLSGFASVLALCSLEHLKIADVLFKYLKYIGGYVGVCTTFFLLMTPHFYSVIEKKVKRIGVIDYILKCREQRIKTLAKNS